MAIIDKPTDYFRTKLYTGNNGSQSITFDEDTNMTPDWSWFKTRNRVADSSIMDVVRGVRKSLTSNNAEDEYTESSGLSSWNTNGFSFDGPGFDLVNSNNTFASWHWKAGTSFTNDASGTGIGTIDSAGSVSTDAGFSIIKWDGTDANGTVAHGLGVVPKMIIFKTRGADENWIVYHSFLGNTKYLNLNNSNAISSATANMFNSTSPTSTTFSVGANSANKNTTMIAYCFADVQGYSKFGSYVGNDNTNGTFVFTGFKPSFVMIKRTNSVNDWIILDNKRNSFNVVDDRLEANTSDAEATTNLLDFVSNGFKMRATYGGVNGASDTFIYMAFAEAPLVGSNNVPCTAR